MASSPHPPRKHLIRIENPSHCRFLTFSCYQRLPLFNNDRIKDAFAEHLAEARFRFGFNLYGWVIMPEHVHLLLWPMLPEHPVSVVLREMKRTFAESVIDRWKQRGAAILPRLTAADGSIRFWQRGGGYDRNIWSDDEFFEKLDYIHVNPVRRCLVRLPEDWPWSSAKWCRGGYLGPVTIDPLPRRQPSDDAGAISPPALRRD